MTAMPREADSIATVLDIDLIRRDGGTQIRVEFNETVADEFAEMLMDGREFPPVVVFFDGAEYWLADGFHRMRAHQRAWRTEISCEVIEGSLRDAILYAVGANDAHGIRRSNRDKQNAVRTLLTDPEWSRWSDREIARRCLVGADMVGAARRSLSPNDSEKRTYTTKHGTTATMDTANIGAAPKPAPAPEWRQTDIEEFTDPAPVFAPRFPPEHARPAEHVRWLVEELLRAQGKLTPAQVAATVSVNVDTYRYQAAIVAAWLEELSDHLLELEKDEDQ